MTAVAATDAKKSSRSRSRKARLTMAQAGQQGRWQGKRAIGRSSSKCVPA